MPADASTPPLLTVADLVVRYRAVAAVKGLSFSVAAGEIVAVVGPNGAGKTSLLSAIAGVVPSTGTIGFAGRPLRGLPIEDIVRLGIAMVPEGRHVLASLTVRENLLLGTTVRRDRAAALREIDAFYDLFPILQERRNEPAGRLSGGEQQQLVIARALLSQPRLLMLDEPSLGLAPRITDQVYAIVREVRERGVTILVVEQNATRALATADRTFVLNGGEFRLSGSRAELDGHPDFDDAYFGVRIGGAAVS